MFKRLVLMLAIAGGLVLPAGASGLYPLSRQQQFDSNGKILSGARLFLFRGGTTTPISGYKDSSLSSPHTNPIVSDSAGRFPLIYLADGFYRQRLTTKSGVLIFDDDGIPVLSSGGGGSGTTVDPDALFKTRDVKIRFDNQPISGYVRMNGRTIGSAASGSTERANADTVSLYEELWPFSNVAVTGGKGASAAADFAANKPLVLPNVAGRGLFGMDDMGAGAQGVLTTTTITGGTNQPGATGGAETLTQTVDQMPVHNHGASASTSVSASGTTSTDGAHTHANTLSDPGHTHGYFKPTATTATCCSGGSPVGVIISGDQTISATTGITINNASAGAHSHTLNITASGSTSVTVNNTGGGSAMNKLSPVMLFMIYVRL